MLQNYIELGKPITFGVSTEGLTLKTPIFEAKSKWSNSIQWRLNGDGLILYPRGVPKHYFSVSGLTRYGYYQEVLALAKKHAVGIRQS